VLGGRVANRSGLPRLRSEQTHADVVTVSASRTASHRTTSTSSLQSASPRRTCSVPIVPTSIHRRLSIRHPPALTLMRRTLSSRRSFLCRGQSNCLARPNLFRRSDAARVSADAAGRPLARTRLGVDLAPGRFPNGSTGIRSPLSHATASSRTSSSGR